jgi:hypothetical protein
MMNIYIRYHESYEKYNTVKLGCTNNIINRETIYKTGEYMRGKYLKVFKILNNKYTEKDIENKLQYSFKDYHKQGTGGIEFYDKIIVVLINDELNKITDLEYKELSEEEILEIERKVYNNDKILLTVKYDKFEYRYKQEYIINLFKKKLELLQYYGILVAPTGYGKTFCYLLMIAQFLIKCILNNTSQNVLYITKRKDLLTDLKQSIKKKIALLQYNKLFPDNKKVNIINLFESFNNIYKYDSTSYNIFVINIDKLTGTKDDISKEIKTRNNLIELMKEKYCINLCIFDEIHWCGSEFAYQMMDYIKSNVDYIIGASATPVRTMYDNQQNAVKIFNSNSNTNNNKFEAVDLEVLEQLSYEECWEQGLILPVEHHYLQINGVIKEEKTGSSKKTYYSLTEAGYFEYLNQINDIWKTTVFGKCIFYFESRKSLLTFYQFLLNNYNKLKHLEMVSECINNIFMSFTISNNTENCDDCNEVTMCINCFTANKIDELELEKYNINNGITLFKNKVNNAILFVIARAIEGFDDTHVEIVANIDYVMNRNILQTMQKIGRVQRICIGSNKVIGHYITPVPNNEKCKDSLLRSIYDYINYVFTKNKYVKGNGSNKQVGFNLKYIKLDESLNITHDDINSGLRKLEFEKGITYRKFIDLLKLNEVHNNIDYYKFKIDNPEINLCDNPFSYYSSKYGFCWADTYESNKNHYYSCEECIERINNLNDCNIISIKKLKKNRKREIELNSIDKKIPNITLYEFYNCNKEKFLIY